MRDVTARWHRNAERTRAGDFMTAERSNVDQHGLATKSSPPVSARRLATLSDTVSVGAAPC
jgi:hypothetical protein